MAQLYFLGNSTNSQMFGCVIKTATKTIVIDGGTSGDYLQLEKFLRDNSNLHIDGWFFTHPHHDHIGAFLQICKNTPDIRIDRILCNFPDINMLKKYGARTENEITMWEEFEKLMDLRFANSFHRIKKGEVFEFDEIKVNVLRVFNEKITLNFVNNSSAVYRIDSPDKRVLILDDLGVDGGKDVMENCSAETLYADYIQLAHHGQDGVNEEFYKYVRPKICLWAAPEWLWNNDNGGGFDSGPWTTVQTRKWMQELGVTEHIVEKDGTTAILI